MRPTSPKMLGLPEKKKIFGLNRPFRAAQRQPGLRLDAEIGNGPLHPNGLKDCAQIVPKYVRSIKTHLKILKDGEPLCRLDRAFIMI